MVYDALQFLVVGYLWDIDGGFLMREGEEMSRWVFMLSQATSAVDFSSLKVHLRATRHKSLNANGERPRNDEVAVMNYYERYYKILNSIIASY